MIEPITHSKLLSWDLNTRSVQKNSDLSNEISLFKSESNLWLWNGGLLLIALQVVRKLPQLSATPVLRIMATCPCFLQTMSVWTAFLFRLAFHVSAHKHRELNFCKTFRRRSYRIQFAPANLSLTAISLCVANIFVFIWVPYFVPMYSEIQVVPVPEECAVLGGITCFTLLYCVYMLRVTVHLVRESRISEPVIPIVQHTLPLEKE